MIIYLFAVTSMPLIFLYVKLLDLLFASPSVMGMNMLLLKNIKMLSGCILQKMLIDTFIYRVVLYDDKMKVLFNLKSGQKNELLFNLIFPDYPEGSGCADENSAKEKETENSVSQSGCSYTPDMVRLSGLEPEWSPIRPSNVRVCLFRHNRIFA